MYPQIRINSLTPKAKLEALAVALPGNGRKLPAEYRNLDDQTGKAISAALKRREFSAAAGELVTIYPPKGPGRLYLLGLGDPAKFAPSAAPLRTAAARLVRAAAGAGLSQVEFHILPAVEAAAKPVEKGKGLTDEVVGRAIGDGLAMGNLNFEQFKGTAKAEKNDKRPALRTLTVSLEKPLVAPALRALMIGQSVNLTRNLAATPPNVANPAYLAAFCRKMARQTGLRCTIIDARKAAALKLNGLLAVGGAGSTPPALIVLEWKGTGTRGARLGRSLAIPTNKTGPVLLVGKAITFDTGGYSLKPAESMAHMKYDKSGGAAVIGAMDAVARLKLPIHVVGLIPAAENLISPTAYRPDDIIRMSNGVTVEVTNTDAEGRVVLADALAYGCKTFKPQAVIDLATLTGGVVVALGPYCAGMFATDRTLRGHLFDAADFTGERLWHLPLWDEHKQQIKGTHGDIANSAGRYASPIQGAAFLSYFVGKGGQPHSVGSNKPVAGEPAWAHLDIAGVSDVQKDTGMFAAGPTGFGVRLLVRALETWGEK